MRYKKIDRRNLRTHYSLTVGNLYSRPVVKKKDPKPDYEVVDGFSYDELYNALKENQIEMIWIEGPVLRKVVLE
jgi:hypothetical protein